MKNVYVRFTEYESDKRDSRADLRCMAVRKCCITFYDRLFKSFILRMKRANLLNVRSDYSVWLHFTVRASPPDFNSFRLKAIPECRVIALIKR